MSVGLHTTVYNWLRELKIPVSKSYIKEQLLSHPDYPSLLSITDTLNELGIENMAVQIEKEHLSKLTSPFIAHLNGNGGEFVVVSKNDNLEDHFSNFFNRWNGVVVAAEKPEGWKHKQNSEWLKKDNNNMVALITILSLLTIFILLSTVFSFSWLFTGLLLIAITGVFISWMIVSKDLGIENKIAGKVCGKEADCNAVIHSDKSKLLFNIGWSDAGIIYFSFLLISLTLASFTNTLNIIYPLLAILASAALPFTLASIYYQWKVIKKWCRLCLFTVGLLWLQFIVILPQNSLNNGFKKTTVSSVALFVFIFFLIGATWFWIKSMLKTNKKLETEKFEAARFRNNPDIFNALLENQKRVTSNPEGLGITIGNPDAENTIIKVCAVYCDPCAKAHPLIDDLLEDNNNLKVQIIFRASDDEKEVRANPVRHLMALYEKNDAALIQRALDDWYLPDKKDYEVFAKKYKLNGELEKQGDKLKAMRVWCDNMKVLATPTFFVNGFQLPFEHYSIRDLKLFINYLNSSKNS